MKQPNKQYIYIKVLPYHSRGNALRDGVKSVVKLLQLGSDHGLAVVPPGGH